MSKSVKNDRFTGTPIYWVNRSYDQFIVAPIYWVNQWFPFSIFTNFYAKIDRFDDLHPSHEEPRPKTTPIISKSIILTRDDMINLLILWCLWWWFSPFETCGGVVECVGMWYITSHHGCEVSCAHGVYVGSRRALVSAVALWCLSREVWSLVSTLSMHVNVCVKCAS